MALRSFADGALFAEVLGDGPLRVLALHGWARRGADFRRSLGGISTLALDLPGFGASPPPSEVIGAKGYADIVAPLLEEFDRPAVLVGHSFGARVAVCLAVGWPERVGPLLLTGAPVLRLQTPAKPGVGYRVMRTLHRGGMVSDGRMESLRRRSGSADYRAASGVMRDILVKVVNESYEDQLARVASRVLLLWGANDDEVPVEVALAAAEILADAEVRVIEGVGHHLPIEAPDELRDAVSALLG